MKSEPQSERIKVINQAWKYQNKITLAETPAGALSSNSKRLCQSGRGAGRIVRGAIIAFVMELGDYG
jgi:hypothetical protein